MPRCPSSLRRGTVSDSAHLGGPLMFSRDKCNSERQATPTTRFGVVCQHFLLSENARSIVCR